MEVQNAQLWVLSLKWPEQTKLNQWIVFQDNSLMFFGGENCDLRSNTNWVICDYKGIFLHFPKENSMLCVSQPCCLQGLAQRGCDPMAFANKQSCYFAFSGGKLVQSPVGFSSSKDTEEEEVLTGCKLSLFLWSSRQTGWLKQGGAPKQPMGHDFAALAVCVTSSRDIIITSCTGSTGHGISHPENASWGRRRGRNLTSSCEKWGENNQEETFCE